MNSPALLLALTPAASAVASRTMAAAQGVGESFAAMMGNVLGGGTPASAATGSESSKPSLAESIQSLTDQLRDWLREQGAGDDYSIDYHLAADGESQLGVSGEAATEVKQLLASDSSWLAKLRQLASSLQAETAQRHQELTPPGVSIEIDDQSTRLR